MGEVTRLTIRAALFLGFGLTFGLWLLTGFQFTQRMAELERHANEINTRYMHGQELLSTVRAQILLGSVYLRDALTEPNVGAAEQYRHLLDDAYESADKALQQYVPVLDSPYEREQLAKLRKEVDGFRNLVFEVLATDSSRWPAMARVILRTLVIPRREDVIRVSDEVQKLNRSEFVEQQSEIARTHQATQRQIWTRLGVALAGSLGIALIAAIYAGRLEDRIRRQGERDLQNARDLQRLSAQLIRAQEEERRTIARELHDEVGQVLTAIKVELAVAERGVAAAGGPAHSLESVRSITDGAIHSVRDLSRLLHPALLDDLGLPAAVDAHLKAFGTRHAIRVQLLHERMEQRLTPEIEAAVFRILQEGLTNVARHAGAKTVRVYLQRLASTVLMTVEDDGMGFDTSILEQPGRAGGLGLIGIRERVANFRGTLRIESTPSKGTRVTVELPARVRLEEDAPEEPAPPSLADVPATEAAHG
jgi:signal transduction histidine kinase